MAFELTSADGVRCPACGGAVDSVECHDCRTRFPTLGSIRVLVDKPVAQLAAWRGGFERMLAGLADQVGQIRAHLRQPATTDASQQRLSILGEALECHGATLRELVSPVTRAAATAATPGTFVPQLGYVQLLRDWGWEPDPREQNQRSLRAVTEAADGELGRVLVLGAGAGRLAVDLHRRARARSTVALDLNPLPLLALDALMRGESLKLWEFPLAPLDVEHCAVVRSLPALSGVEGIGLVLADARALPFSAGTFDTVVTPWFIDRVGPDPVSTLSAIHRLLRPGGRWINHGPLLYDAEIPWPHRYSIGELRDWSARLGFRNGPLAVADLPYLVSPASAQAKRERVFTFAAERLESQPWLDDDTAPVPAALRSLAERSRDPIAQWCARHLDGAVGLETLARKIARQTGMSRAAALQGVRARLHRQCPVD